MPRMPTSFMLPLLVVMAMLSSWSSALIAAEDPADDKDTKVKTVQHIRPEACKKCHEEIYEQWKGSMHANSSALRDPIHGAFYQKVMGDPKKEGIRGPQIPVKKDKYPVCLKCHAPVAAIEKKTKLDAKQAYENGTSCVVCHSFYEFKGTDSPKGKPWYGIDAYKYDTKSLYGPSGISYTTERTPEDAKWPTPVHHPQPMKGNKAALFKSNDACMGCHDKRKNAHGTPLCLTGAEYAKEKSFINCQACHMAIVSVPKLEKGKVVPGEFVSIADHSMSGGHDGKMITRGIALSMETDKKKDGTIKAKLTVRNRLPHSYPTGAPFRNFFIKVTAYDKDGQELWKNYKVHPIKDDPKSAFWYAIGEADKKKPTSPPYATDVLKDSRLGPNETRDLEYEIPKNDKIAILRAEALYDLLLPPLKHKMKGKLPEDLLKSKLAASVELRL
ncbi:MAG: cytochrome c family protein [Gammaproteobacteria bacterium]|nr:cytochrome c family protein [Gammaproteobacteria bacterium]